MTSSTRVVVSCAIAGATAATLMSLWVLYKQQRRRHSKTKSCGSSAYESLIGNTPLVKLERPSALIGRSIYVKMESMNPGGTGKDRAALSMIKHAEQSRQLPTAMDTTASGGSSDLQRPFMTSPTSDVDEHSPTKSIIQQAMKRSRTGGLVVEGTSGSTGISLATLCAERGHACLVVLPDDQASEKQAILTTLGAVVHIVPCCAISNPNHYVNIARRLAETAQRDFQIPAVFINQFENEANYDIHFRTTGPEIWRQCPHVDAFVMSSGTGGTIAGVGNFLKERSRGKCRVVLVDPPGSALYHRVHHGVAYAPQQRERVMRRHRYDTLAEGIGLDRMTANFRLGMDVIDDAIRVTDQEAVDMAHWLLRTEGLWVGSSSAMNLVGAIRVASQLKPDSFIVTVVCDAGQRHVTRFWNPDFVREWGLIWPGDEERIPDCLKEYYSS